MMAVAWLLTPGTCDSIGDSVENPELITLFLFTQDASRFTVEMFDKSHGGTLGRVQLGLFSLPLREAGTGRVRISTLVSHQLTYIFISRGYDKKKSIILVDRVYI